MDVSVTKNDNLYTFDIKVPKAMVEQSMKQFATSIQPNVTINGFRKGSAPLDVVKTHYAEAIKAEVSTKLLYESIQKALVDNNIKNPSNPVLLEEFRPSKTKKYSGIFGLDGSLKFKVSIEGPPELDVKDYLGVEIFMDPNNYDEWLSKELFKSQVSLGSKEEVTRPAQISDEIIVDFKGFLDDQEFDGGSHENYSLIIGNGDFIEGFETAFIGRSANEELDVKCTFPANYPVPTLAGKDVVFQCKLKEVYQITPHELNDTLAMMLSYASLDDMYVKYKEMWDAQFDKPVRSQMFNQIMDKVMKSNPFTVPESWIQNETSLTIRRMNLDVKLLEGNQEMTKALMQVAERSLRISYILDKIAEKEPGLLLTLDEVEKAANTEGQAQNMSGYEVLNALKKQNQYDAFMAFVQQQKTMDYLINNAKVLIKENV